MEKELFSEINQLSQKFSADQATLQEAQHIITDTLMKISELEQQDLVVQLKGSEGSDLTALKKTIRQFHTKRTEITQSARYDVAKAI